MDRAETRSGEVLSRAVGACGAQAFISLLICERDKYLKARSEIHTSRREGASSAAPSPPPPWDLGKTGEANSGHGEQMCHGAVE